MIHPSMGTMLLYNHRLRHKRRYDKKALLEAAAVSFNRISVDGDTSTNDMCSLMANGLAAIFLLQATAAITAFSSRR